ncbi:MAG: fasciclin domain-containing protein [Chitinophagaceae bacterium]|nr:fasciclin domain-containing protein [Chitinophagaceae bacterium]MCW5929014.1 fasciclin domain-containing protein [Chitinophagaceae bacterium]
MKKILFTFLIPAVLFSCNSETGDQSSSAGTDAPAPVGQSGVKDETSRPNIVQTAVGSEQHSTLVAAVKAAGLVDALSNAGPFTVFAPTNEAFDKLPKGTVENLLKPENKADLSNILEYHTYVGSLSRMLLADGEEFEQVNAKKVKISRKGDKIFVNDNAEIIATISTSNGLIHVIDNVLLPPGK